MNNEQRTVALLERIANALELIADRLGPTIVGRYVDPDATYPEVGTPCPHSAQEMRTDGRYCAVCGMKVASVSYGGVGEL